MKKLLFILLLIPLFSISQTAEDFFNNGTEKANLKDYYGAIADYTKAIELNPDDAYNYYERGFSKEDLGDLDGACADWKKAASLGDENSAKLVRDECN